jgi:hypothetical protein
MAAANKRQKTKEPGEILVLGHVAQAVNKNQQADQRDHDGHDRPQRVQHPAQLHGGGAVIEPAEIARGPSPNAAWSKKAAHDTRKEMLIAPMASPALNRRRRRAATRPTPAASSGAVGMSQRYLMMDSILSL